MDMTPKQIARELFLQNQNATPYEIKFFAEAETNSASAPFIVLVTLEYERLQASEQKTFVQSTSAADDGLWSRPSWIRHR